MKFPVLLFSAFFSRLNPFGLMVMLDADHKATGELYFDNGEAAGMWR